MVMQHDALSKEIQQVAENDSVGGIQGLTPFLVKSLLQVDGRLQLYETQHNCSFGQTTNSTCTWGHRPCLRRCEDGSS